MVDLKSVLTPAQKRFIRKVLQKTLVLVPHSHNLDFLALKYGTDKRAHGYIEHYQRIFAPLRKRALNILEIGVGGYKDSSVGGESLRMWQEYFPNSLIYSFDIEDKRAFEDKRIKIFQGNQNDPFFLEDLAAKIGRIDIVIDDGSHISSHIITSFRTLFPKLAENGIYVIEDLHTSYWPGFGGNWRDLNSTATAVGMLKSLADGLHHDFIPQRNMSYFDSHIRAVHFYKSISFIFKGRNTETLTGYMLEDFERASREM